MTKCTRDSYAAPGRMGETKTDLIFTLSETNFQNSLSEQVLNEDYTQVLFRNYAIALKQNIDYRKAHKIKTGDKRRQFQLQRTLDVAPREGTRKELQKT